MDKQYIEKYRQAIKELHRYLQSGDYASQKPERAFIDWYIEARFGENGTKRITDGSNDGGVDAIIDSNGYLYVIQSKYESTGKVSLVTRNEIGSFRDLSKLFKQEDLRDEYSNWIDSIDPKHKILYNDTHDTALSTQNKVRFLFITTKRYELPESDLFEVEDIQNISALWYLYSEGFTPPTEYIDLRLEDSWQMESKSGYRTFVGVSDIQDFLKLMKVDKNERLFAQNVRTNLHSKVNEKIRKTYENEPEIFWLGNNGIYIVCNKVNVTGGIHKLTFPSVINGSQTLHSISESQKRHHCKILVRILEMDVMGDQRLLSDVIRRTNTQNSMKLINLFAHDISQLCVARHLDKYRIYYERREREWQNEKKSFLTNYLPVNAKDVAQWISTTREEIGLGTARSQVSELYEDINYKKLFGNFDIKLRSPEYDNLTELVWAGLLTKHLPRHLPTKHKPFAKISRLFLVKLFYDAIHENQNLKQTIPNLVRDHRFGRRKIPNSILTATKKVLERVLKIQKAEQRKDPNVDFSNFFKRDQLITNAYNSIPKTEIKSLSKILIKESAKIL